jgi:glycosyltransferase involved in cell wall biosynthesis
MSLRTTLRVMLVQTQAENAGAQQISRWLDADFVARGYDVHQVFFYRNTGSFDGQDRVEFCSLGRPSKPLAFLRFLMRLYGATRRIRPDVVISFQHYGNLIAAPIARLAGAKGVIANQVSAGALLRPAIRVADKLLGAIGVYDRIVVLSRHTEEMYADYPRSYRERMIRLDSGFEDKTSSLSKAEARSALGLPHGAKLLGCAARLHHLKQLDCAIAVLPLIPGAHLALAGHGPDRERLEALARDQGLADRVHFLGELSPAKVGVLYAALDCFVFPSCAESSPLAPVEAAQTGVPVVANGIDPLREVLSVDGRPCAIFADARDPDAFAAAIGVALSGDADVARLTANGRRLKERRPLSAMMDAYSDMATQLSSRQ